MYLPILKMSIIDDIKIGHVPQIYLNCPVKMNIVANKLLFIKMKFFHLDSNHTIVGTYILYTCLTHAEKYLNILIVTI